MVNRAQRCEFHKLAVFLVGGGEVWSCVQSSCLWPFWSSKSLRAILKELEKALMGVLPRFAKWSNRRDDSSIVSGAKRVVCQ